MQDKTSIKMYLGLAGTTGLSRVIALLVLIIISQVVIAATHGLSDEEMAWLKRGEILLQTIHTEKPGAAARVTALLHTNATGVWSIIGYCKYELIYVKGLKVCEVLEQDQFQMTVHHQLRNSWYTPTLDFVFEASRDSVGTGQAKLVSGDLKVLDGQWKLFPLAGEESVIVVHEIRIQSKMPAPRWLVRRTLRNDLPDMMACIRGLAKASGSDRHIERDLKRCPGDISVLAK